MVAYDLGISLHVFVMNDNRLDSTNPIIERLRGLPRRDPPPALPVYELVGANIRRFRKEAGLTQRELAAELAHSRLSWDASRVSKIEKGHPSYTPDLNQLLAVANVLGVSILNLFDTSACEGLSQDAELVAGPLPVRSPLSCLDGDGSRASARDRRTRLRDLQAQRASLEREAHAVRVRFERAIRAAEAGLGELLTTLDKAERGFRVLEKTLRSVEQRETKAAEAYRRAALSQGIDPDGRP